MDEGFIIGKVTRCVLRLLGEGDTVFSVLWWGDRDKTVPVDFVSCESKVLSALGIELLDISTYATFDGNRCDVLIPEAVVQTLQDMEDGVWFFSGVSADEKLPMVEGPCRVRLGVVI